MSAAKSVRINRLATATSLGIASLFAVAGPVMAQGEGIPAPAGGMPVGPMTAYPSVEYSVQRNSNITLQSPSGQVISDTIQTLKPAVRLEGKSGANTFGAGLGFDSGRYHKSSGDNYDDDNASAFVDLNPDARVHLRLNAKHVDGHDPRGSTTDPLTPTPSRSRQDTFGGIFGFGAKGAQGRFELEASTENKRYINNRAVTTANDRDENVFGGTFYWRIAPRTSLLAQAKRVNSDFKDPTSLLDSKTNYYLFGATWEATAATTGVVKVGQIKKDFDSSLTPDFSATGWDAQVQWAPLSYSKWQFVTSRQPRETSGNFGSFIWGTSYTATWTHDWNSQVTTAANLARKRDEFRVAGRNDDYNTLGLRVTYKMRRWLSFGADANHERRDSSVDSADYTRNILLLFVNATL